MPDLDEQEIDAFMRLIRDSKAMRKDINIRLFDEFEDLTIVGLVQRIDQYRRKIFVEDEWIGIKKLIGVEMEGK